MEDDNRSYEKTGYLHEHFRLFHLRDTDSREYTCHYHDFDKIIYFIEGRADYIIEGKKYELEPYDFILVNRNEIHRPIVDFASPYERLILYIEHGFLESYKTKEYCLTDCFEKTREEGANVVRFPAGVNRQLFEMLMRLEKNEGEKNYAGELYGEILFLEFMILLNRACIDNEFAYRSTAKYNRKIVEIIQYINGHMKEELSIEMLSENFYMSKYHMMRQFKKETGYSIHQYITEKRILAAKNMILAGMPATVASIECGFKDYSTFSRAFRKKTGSMPTGTLNRVSRRNT